MGLPCLPSRRVSRILILVGIGFLVLLLRWSPSTGYRGRFLGGGTGPRYGTPSAPSYQPGRPPPPGQNISKALVIAKVHDEDTDWVHEAFPDMQTAIYVADDPSAPLHPPANKGHEVMVYLTYIIDSYEDLPDVMLFMHSHRSTWHNNEILGSDAVEIISRLSSERVIREGYMNLRCHWFPGCPDWIKPGRLQMDNYKEEEVVLDKTWSEIFPEHKVPKVLAQPCCGQFALSRERILATPKSKFEFYRDWLLETKLDDYTSGRVWEYMWHYVFSGKEIYCPDQHVCYCDGYGVCFEDDDAFEYWFKLKSKESDLYKELAEWELKQEILNNATTKGTNEGDVLEVPEVGRDVALRQEIDRLSDQADEHRNRAVVRGNDPRIRAKIAGRAWHEGDGF